MIRKIIYISIGIFFCVNSLYAQKEAYNWIFGYNAGMTWNTTRDFEGVYVYGGSGKVTLKGMPTNLSSVMEADMGCFTLSDKTGKLLMFSNGAKLWNAKQVQMTSGTPMIGSSGNAQSGILFPYPGHPNKYIAATIGSWSFDEFGYTVIDMTANSGAGRVESLNNSFPSGHKGKLGSSVASVRHANGEDYWVVAPGKGSTSYMNAWRVKSNGIEAPVSTQLPAAVTENKANGYLKFSPDGKYFVWGTFSDRKLFFGKFDSSTGQFSDIKYITSSKSDGNEFYGVEFSMSGNYLYVTETKTEINPTTFYLYAFDFKELLNAIYPQSYYQNQMKRIPFPASTGGMPAALQLGPDGRMYIAGYPYPIVGSPSCLYVLENPEQFDNLKIYRLDNFLNGTVHWGLPSFAASWFELKIGGETEFCLDNLPKEYTLVISKGVGSEELAFTRWNFGDGSATVDDYTVSDGSIQSQYHTYSVAGEYEITVTAHRANGTEITSMGRQTLNVKVLPVPSVTISAPDVCVGSSGTITVSVTSGATVNWYKTLSDVTPFQTGNTCSTGVQTTEGTVTFYVEAVNATGCSTGRTAVPVLVKKCGTEFIPVNPHLRSGYK